MSTSASPVVAGTALVHEQVLDSRVLPLQTVIIFQDRAELRRVFEVTLKQGLNNIVVEVGFLNELIIEL